MSRIDIFLLASSNSAASCWYVEKSQYMKKRKYLFYSLVFHQHESTVQLLLENGASTRMYDASYMSPMDIANLQDNASIYHLLNEMGEADENDAWVKETMIEVERNRVRNAKYYNC